MWLIVKYFAHFSYERLKAVEMCFMAKIYTERAKIE
jgi:hypothetical protein